MSEVDTRDFTAIHNEVYRAVQDKVGFKQHGSTETTFMAIASLKLL